MKTITKTTMPLAALAGIALLSQTSEAALSVGLVANYTFDVDASDATGNHDAAAMTNGATNPAATSGGQGKFGEAFQFTHTAQANAQWVEIPAAATSGLTQFTMSIWVNTTSATSNGATFSTLDTIWGTNNSGGSDFGINTWFGDAGYWHDLGAPGRRAFITRLSSTPEPIADGAWHHLALVNDGSQAQMYVDGVLAGGDVWGNAGPKFADDVSSTVTGLALPNFATSIGSNGLAGTPGSVGDDGAFYPALLVDDAALWNRPLTTTEIADIWNGGAGQAVVPEPSTAILCAIGLLGLVQRRRRTA